MKRRLILLFVVMAQGLCGEVLTGIDQLFQPEYLRVLNGKRVALFCNQTAVNRELESTVELLHRHAKEGNYRLVALFGPEHGIRGDARANEPIPNQRDASGIPIFSLYGATHRPTKEMLEGMDLIVIDIQDIGSRSYTYLTTVCYLMEEAAKHPIKVVVLDRPNPMNGIVVDGPMLKGQRSIVGYINVPYCHGMTLGELARFFNAQYKLGCQLEVIPLKGWKREMSFADTGLPWIPTSPNIPEPDTPFFYATTGILGEMKLVNIGVGGTLPFKVVVAPWINADTFAKRLNEQQFPGVHFVPFHWRPTYGRYAHQPCHGTLIRITDPHIFLPVATQYLLIGVLKGLYPKHFQDALKTLTPKKEMFHRVNGTDEVFDLLSKPAPVVWPLRTLHQEEKLPFMDKRQRALLYK